jgi:hypothetical protein
MYAFYVSVHARPAEATAGPIVELAGGMYPTLVFPHAALAATTLGITFEEAAAALSKLPRMYCEPDGSLVWVSPHGDPTWQVDGNLFDRAGQLLLVDLKGTCPAAAFGQLLFALGRPRVPLMFQLVREAVFLDEATFRAYAERDANSTS